MSSKVYTLPQSFEFGVLSVLSEVIGARNKEEEEEEEVVQHPLPVIGVGSWCRDCVLS